MSNNTALKKQRKVRVGGFLPWRIFLGQIFYEESGRITGMKRCWMAECMVDPDELGVESEEDFELFSDCCEDNFIFPILPSRKEREMFLRRRDECWINTEFLDRQNTVLELYRTLLEDFIQEMPEFREDLNEREMLELIQKAVDGGKFIKAGDSVGEPFCRHLYAVADSKGHFAFLECDDDSYRPEVRPAPKSKDGVAHYDDFLETARGWRQLSDSMTEKLFRNVSEAAINALNDGLDSFMRIEQKTLPGTASQVYRVMDHTKELQLAPTLWMINGEISMKYDILANWSVGEDGMASADLGEFIVQHRPGTGGKGEISWKGNRPQIE